MGIWLEDMKLELLLRDLSTAILAIIIGLLVLRKLNWPVKLLLLQALVYTIVDIIGFYIHKNLWLYNLYVPVETGLLLASAATELGTIKAKRTIGIVFFVFLILFIVELIRVELGNDFVYLSVLTHYFLIACLYTYLLFRRINPSNNTALNVSHIVICFGIVVYCAGSIPCLAAMRQLMFVDLGLSQELFVKIVVLLAAFRYFLLAIGLAITGKKIVI